MVLRRVCTGDECHTFPQKLKNPFRSSAGADPERLRFVAWKRGGAYTPSEDAEECIRVPIPIPYTLPPAQYKKPEDTAWAVDYPWPGLDHFGCTVEAPYGAFYGLTEDMEWADLGRRP